MTVRRLATRPPLYLAIGGLALALSAIGGSNAVAGMALGLFGAAFNVIALWFLISLLGKASEKADTGKSGTTLILIAFFLKVPVYIAMGSLANRIGNPAPACFLGGIGLVYSCLVGWALARS